MIIMSWSFHEDFMYTYFIGLHVYFIVDQLKILISYTVGLPMKTLLFIGSEENFM